MQQYPKYSQHLKSMKSKSENSNHTELDSIFLKEYIHECQACEWVDMIEEERIKSFRKLWSFVNYSLQIKELKVDYYGETSKTIQNQGVIKNRYPVLRFDIVNLQMLYKIDLISKYAYMKVKDLEIKHFENQKTPATKKNSFINNSSSSQIESNYNSKEPSYDHRKPFMPNRKLEHAKNMDETWECMKRQDQIMSDYRRVDANDTADDFADEFDGIDEMKVRGIERTVNASKKIAKPSNKIGSFNHTVMSPGINRNQTTKNQKLNIMTNNDISSDLNQTSGSKFLSFNKHTSKSNNMSNEIVEEVIFSLNGVSNSDCFQFQAQVDDNKSLKISKNISIGHIQTKFDFKNIQNLVKIFDILSSLHESLSGKSDLTSDGFWWLLSRNILKKLKISSLSQEDNSVQIISEENLTNDDDEHKDINIPLEAEMVKPYSSNLRMSQNKTMNSLSFSELYEIFIKKLDQSLFGKNEFNFNLNSQGAIIRYENNKTFSDLEIPIVNVSVVHERGEASVLNFMGFKIRTNMTVRPVIDIFKNLCKVDNTEIKSCKANTKVQPSTSVKRNELAKKDTRSFNKPKEVLNKHAKINKQINPVIVDESIINTTPMMNINQPASKFNETDSECDISSSTPKHYPAFGASHKGILEDAFPNRKHNIREAKSKPPLKDYKVNTSTPSGQSIQKVPQSYAKMGEKVSFGFGMQKLSRPNMDKSNIDKSNMDKSNMDKSKIERPIIERPKTDMDMIRSVNSSTNNSRQLRNQEESSSQSINSTSSYVRSYRKQAFINDSEISSSKYENDEGIKSTNTPTTAQNSMGERKGSGFLNAYNRKSYKNSDRRYTKDPQNEVKVSSISQISSQMNRVQNQNRNQPQTDDFNQSY